MDELCKLIVLLPSIGFRVRGIISQGHFAVISSFLVLTLDVERKFVNLRAFFKQNEIYFEENATLPDDYTQLLDCNRTQDSLRPVKSLC